MPRNYQRKTNDVTMSWAFRKLPFWERVEAQTLIDEKGCHIFTGTKDECGYGRIWQGKKLVRLHRATYEKLHGEIPKGLVILHKCDVPACINPSHLALGTQGDNVKDMFEKKRNKVNAGSAHGMAKLTENDIPTIRQRLNAGDTCVAIGKDYGVSDNMIRHIKMNRSWRHVDGKS
jgi:hypothetical protein